MKQNLGNADRIIRIFIGLGLFAFMLLVPSPTCWWGLVGFIPVLTAYFGSCPLYTLVGIDTRMAAHT